MARPKRGREPVSPHQIARFRAFVEEIGSERGNARGWRRWLAEELGISYEHLWRVVSGRSGLSVEVLVAAADRFDFDVAYFYSKEGGIGDFPRLRPTDLLDARHGTERDSARAFHQAIPFLEDLSTYEPQALAAASQAMAQMVLQSPMVQAAWAVANATTDAERVALGAQLAVEIREFFMHTAPNAAGHRSNADTE